MGLGTQVLHQSRQPTIQSLVTKYRFHPTLLFCRPDHCFQFTPSTYLWVMLSLACGEGMMTLSSNPPPLAGEVSRRDGGGLKKPTLTES
jgi:hypothetical protein